MTRQEEIEKIASAFAIDEVKDTCNPASKRGLLYVGFITGAEWADAHPVVKVGGALKNYERGYEDAIEKACDLLYEYNRKQADKMFGTVHTADVTINVAEFRKAMKGE